MLAPTEISPVSWLGKGYEEVASIAETDGSILLVPVGALEQHGPHLPTGTDTILANALTIDAAERVVDDLPVLVTPPVWAGVSSHHLPFGSTIDAGVETLRETMACIVESAVDNGFTTVLFVNGHGGNADTVGTVVKSQGAEHPRTTLSSLFYLDLAPGVLTELRESEIAGVHSGEIETSLVLHVAPGLVDMDRAEPVEQVDPNSHAPNDLFDNEPLSVFRTYDEYTDTGAVGNPTLATAEKGERLYETIVTAFVSVLEELHRENR